MSGTSDLKTQLSKDWVAIPLAPAFTLKTTKAHVDARLGHPKWEPDATEGLGPMLYLGLEREGRSRYALGVSDWEDGLAGVFIEAHEDIDPWTLRWELLNLLGLTHADIEAYTFATWGAPTPAQSGGDWALWRQDDHGTVVEIVSFSTAAEAERARDLLDRQGHPQAYWIARK